LSKWETLGNIYGETTFEGATDAWFAGSSAKSSGFGHQIFLSVGIDERWKEDGL